MNLKAVLRVAVLALARNKMRSILTMLGIIIGVGAVIASVAVGRELQVRFSSRSATWVTTWSGSRRRTACVRSKGTKTLILADAKAVQQQISLFIIFHHMWTRRCKSSTKIKNWFTMVRGVAPEFFAVRRMGIARGSSSLRMTWQPRRRCSPAGSNRRGSPSVQKIPTAHKPSSEHPVPYHRRPDSEGYRRSARTRMMSL